TAEPIVIPFSGPIDKNAIAETVVIEPATSVTKQWVGQNLVIIPDHPLAPNTTYTVSLKPRAVPPTPNPANPTSTPRPEPAPSPVVVHFTTVKAPVAPVTPPSYLSANLSFGLESRLADAGTVFNGAWTPNGQLLVTRPAGQPGPGSSPSPSATATASGAAAPATTDIWLMSTPSAPIRLVVPGGSFPAAAPSGGVFAAWQVTSSNKANLGIWDLQGNSQGTIATLESVPDRAPVWIGSDLYVATGGKAAQRIATSPSGQTWSDLNWAPDGASLMLAGKPVGASSSASRLMLINADGRGLRDFGFQQEYSSPQWASRGDLVLFTRQDEAGGRAFWTASTAPSESDAAQKQAMAEVDRFMQARLQGNSTAARDSLDAAG